MKLLRRIPLFLISALSLGLWGFWLHEKLGTWSRYLYFILHPGSKPLSYIYSDVLTFWATAHLFLRNFSDPRFDPNWIYNIIEFHRHAAVPNSIAYFFVYPPFTIWLTAILAPFSYVGAFPLWIAVMIIPGIVLLARAGVPKAVIAGGLLSPAALSSIGYGQFAILTASLYIAGLLAVENRPARSGILLGLVAIKPQNGLLGPIALIARGQVRSLLWGAATVAVLAVTITLAMGPAVWVSFFRQAPAIMNSIVIAPFPQDWELRGVSVFWMARSLGASVDLAWWVQTAGALLAVLVCFLSWRRAGTNRVALVTLTAILTVFMVPYGLLYDLSAVSIMTCWLAWQRGRITLVDGMVWTWPLYCQLVGVFLHMEMTPLVLLLGAVQAWRELSPRPAAIAREAEA